MRRLLILALVVTTASLLFFHGWKADSNRGLVDPSGKYGWELGAIDQGDANQARHVFALINQSDTPLNILGVTTSCGCTTAQISHKTLMPQESIQLAVQADWSKKAGDQASQVVVLTDSIVTPTVSLKLSAFVRAGCVAWPDTVDFGQVPRDGAVVRRRIYLSGGSVFPDFHVVAVRQDKSVIHVEKVGKDRSAYELGRSDQEYDLVLDPTTTQGHGEVCFDTNISSKPTLFVSWQAEIVDPMAITPQSLFIVADSAGRGRGSIRISNASGLRIALKSTNALGALKFPSVTTLAQGGSVSATIQVVGATQPYQEADTQIVVGQRTFRLPVTVVNLSMQ